MKISKLTLTGVLAIVLSAIALTSSGVAASALEAYYRRIDRKTAGNGINEKVLAFAQSKLGQQVGDGECGTLAAFALSAAGAKPAEGYVWGYGTHSSHARPGDIIQFTSAKFESPTSWILLGAPNHTAIVESVRRNRITLLHQNISGNKTVVRQNIILSQKTQGTFKVYRPKPL